MINPSPPSLINKLSDLEYTKILSPIDNPTQSGLVTFYLSGIDQEAACLKLWEDNRIIVRNVEYPDSIRVSLNFFNTDQEIEFLIDSIRQLLNN